MRDLLSHNGATHVTYHPTFAHPVAQSGNDIFLFFIFMLPFQRSFLFRENLFDIQGLKPFNLLSALVLVYLVFRTAPFRSTDKIEQTSIRIFLLYLATFAVAIIRSIPNAPLFHSHFPDAFPESYLDYVLSLCVVPAFYILPFLFILKCMCSFQELERITTVICFSILLLSVAFIVLVLMNPGVLQSSRNELADLASGNRDEMAELCETYLGVHYNTIGTIYICTTPLLLYKVLTRNALWIVAFGLSLVAVLLLQSRSALVTLAISYCLLLIQRRRFGILIIGPVVIGVASLLWIGPTLDALLSIGFGNSSDFSVDALLTGRLDYIWAPLLNEWTSDTSLFLFGAGRFGIMTSQLWGTGALIHTSHAHNAIIDFFLDCGVILSTVLVILLIVGLTTAWRVGRRLDSDLYWALLVCLFGFGVGMITERQIFPTIDNVYVFPIIAMLINLARLHHHLDVHRG